MAPDLYYAGIGSRQTPEHIQTIMNQVAHYLENEGWTLRSGAAHGADSAFENGIQNKEIYLPWAGYNHSDSNLNPKEHPFTQQEQDFSSWFHPAWSRCSPSARLLHCRNTRVIFGFKGVADLAVRPSRFVVCWTIKGMATGGTGQALRIAQKYNIPIFNFGIATTTRELEQILLDIDELQRKIKS